jgi:uncharacterized protein YodC (DUF2158 family)
LSGTVPASLRRRIRQRAENHCEYCQLSQLGQEATFHVDHVVPVKEGGPTVADNLALACVSCSLHKGARLKLVDPATGDEETLFNPRQDGWDEHFEWRGVRLVARTETGRVTIETLDMNRPLIISIREEEALLGRHPPS